MVLKKNLVLVGMMGSGKSTIGKIIANRLKFDFIDLDNEIEKREKILITKIFELKGEKYFREVEEDVALSKLEQNSKIISLGGGSFLNEKIRKLVLKNHISFWLNWDKDTLIERIIKSGKRPLVKNLSKKDLTKMIIERSRIYAEANFKIDCKKLSKNEIVRNIINIYEIKQN
tara:strand:+ start:56 stop:574 length:519 start_codon:yes stop_codon:yes gene_type:complete